MTTFLQRPGGHEAIIEAVQRTLATVVQGEPSGSWAVSQGQAATRALLDAGWLGIGIPARLGGEGGGLLDAVAVIDAVTAVGWPSPAADVLLITGALLSRADVPLPAGRRLVISLLEPATLELGGRISYEGSAAWTAWADHLLVVAADGPRSSVVAMVPRSAVAVVPSDGDAGARCAGLCLDAALPEHSATVPVPIELMLELVRTQGALARCVQTVAALRRVLTLTVLHVKTRHQFGRPLAAQQAVQQYVARLAGEVAAAESAVAVALAGALPGSDGDASARLATAKIRSCRAAGMASRLAHQLHGAMGTTREHELHRHTVPLLTWRDEFGNEHYWAKRLLASALAADDLWSWLVDEFEAADCHG